MMLFLLWLLLIVATLLMAAIESSQWLWLTATLTAVKGIMVSEFFMALKKAPLPWRLSMMLYSVLIPASCYFIATG